MCRRCSATVFSTAYDYRLATNLVEVSKRSRYLEQRTHLPQAGLATDAVSHIQKITPQSRIVGPRLSDIRRISRFKIPVEATLLKHVNCMANSDFYRRKQSSMRSAQERQTVDTILRKAHYLKSYLAPQRKARKGKMLRASFENILGHLRYGPLSCDIRHSDIRVPRKACDLATPQPTIAK